MSVKRSCSAPAAISSAYSYRRAASRIMLCRRARNAWECRDCGEPRRSQRSKASTAALAAAAAPPARGSSRGGPARRAQARWPSRLRFRRSTSHIVVASSDLLFGSWPAVPHRIMFVDSGHVSLIDSSTLATLHHTYYARHTHHGSTAARELRRFARRRDLEVTPVDADLCER